MKRISATICSLAIALSGLTAHADSADSWNARVEPLGLLLGLVNARIDYKLGEQFVFGPSILFWNLKVRDLRLRAAGVGLNGEYFFDKAFESGWVIDGGINYSAASFENEDDNGTTKKTKLNAFRGQVLGGYHWFWGNTFNLALGAGLAANTIGKVKIKDQNDNVTEEKSIPAVTLAFEANLGLTF